MGAPAEARFRPGDPVRVRTARPPGHCRTPGYVRGRTGTVAAVRGAFRNPETLAYGGDGLPKRPLYTVRFSPEALWGAAGGRDPVLVDLYEHWLEPVEAG